MFLNNLKEIIENTNIDISEEDIFNFLKIKYRWVYKYPWGQHSVEFIDLNGHNNCEDLFTISGFLNFENWLYKYNLGFSSIISNVFDLNEDLRNLDKKIYDEFGKKVNANFYINKGFNKKPSFDHHNHEYDVIVKQIYGETEWKLNENFISMKKNNVLVIPKFTNHSVIKNNTKKLSLTINLI
jgi:hypothetical protein